MILKAFTLLLILGLKSVGAAQCSPPGAAVAELQAYLRYENGLSANKPKSEGFSVLKIGNRVFFRLDRRLPDFPRGYSPVYVYDPSERMRGSLTCPADATWVHCVADWVRHPDRGGDVVSGNERPHYGEEKAKESTCEFNLYIPEWKPSSNNPEKRKLAVELAQEIRNYVGSDASSIYIRDFNIHDPDIWVYIVTTKGQSAFQGCSFDANKSPHCYGWHLFGQTPVDSLKKQIMVRPLRLYPPPIGRP